MCAHRAGKKANKAAIVLILSLTIFVTLDNTAQIHSFNGIMGTPPGNPPEMLPARLEVAASLQIQMQGESRHSVCYIL